jgi:hypothetical protein
VKKLAIISKPISASFRVINENDERIHNYTGVKTNAGAIPLELFAEAIGQLTGQVVGKMFYAVKTELGEEA